MLQGIARGFNSRISKQVFLLCLALRCTILRSRRRTPRSCARSKPRALRPAQEHCRQHVLGQEKDSTPQNHPIKTHRATGERGIKEAVYEKNPRILICRGDVNEVFSLEPARAEAGEAGEESSIRETAGADLSPIPQIGCRPGKSTYDPSPLATSSSPCWKAVQARVAHLMREGYWMTPLSAARSSCSGNSLSPTIMLLKCEICAFAASRLLPINRSVIIEAEAWLIEQPCPLNLTSATLSSLMIA